MDSNSKCRICGASALICNCTNNLINDYIQPQLQNLSLASPMVNLKLRKRNNELERIQLELYEYIDNLQALIHSYEATDKNLTELISTVILEYKNPLLKAAFEAKIRVKEIEDLKGDQTDSAEILIDKFKTQSLRGFLPSYQEVVPINLYNILYKFYGLCGLDSRYISEHSGNSELDILMLSLKEKEEEIIKLNSYIETMNIEYYSYKEEAESKDRQHQLRYETLFKSKKQDHKTDELLNFYKIKCNRLHAENLETDRKYKSQIEEMTQAHSKSQKDLQETIANIRAECHNLNSALQQSSPHKFESEILRLDISKPQSLQLHSKISLSPRLFNTLVGHTGTVFSVCVSPDGNFIISGSGDNTVIIWSFFTNTQIGMLNGHTDIINSVAMSSDGRFIISGSADTSIRVWDFATKSQEAVLMGHSSSVSSVCISPDMRFIVSGSNDNSIRIWNFFTKTQDVILNGHTCAVTSVCISPNGIYIVSGSRDGSVRVWNMLSNSMEAVLTGHRDRVNTVCISADGSYIISGSHDNTIRVWNFSIKRQEEILTGHKAAINSVCISQDGRFIVSGSEDKSIKVWNIGSMSQEAILSRNTSSVISVCMSPDGRYVVSGTMHKRSKKFKSRDCSVKVLSLYGV